jgi:hypothetical protein
MYALLPISVVVADATADASSGVHNGAVLSKPCCHPLQLHLAFRVYFVGYL